MSLINARKATPEDSKDLFNWRNDVQTRAMSHTSEAIAWEDHSDWFSASLERDNRSLVICEKKEIPVAVVRFDVSGDRALISINLAPDMRGKGLATPCLKSAIAFFEAQVSGIKTLDAEIKPENEASRRSFEATGFTQTGTSHSILHYEYAL